MLKVYNTLSREKEIFKPIKKNQIGLYACGPTVYWYAHIGNLRAYIFEDVLRRNLEYNKYQVNHIINITDVGHLTSDSDTGQDKIEKGAQRENKTVWQIAQYYAKAFKKDLKRLNIKSPTNWTKATDYIDQQIKLISKLEKKGFTYLIKDGVYFDTSKIKDYGQLWGTKKVSLKPGARIEMVSGKKNLTDFALWKLSPVNQKRQMEWLSPWGKGFPGWHTECVVMAIDKLGIPFDIHCGGIDHIQIHHTNEIAQAKALYNKPLSHYWLHSEFLTLKGGKMAKSKGETITLTKLIEKGFNPLAFRYLCLTAHYRSLVNFSWQSLKSAQKSINSLKEKTIKLTKDKTNQKINIKKEKQYLEKFKQYLNDDLNTAKGLALAWQTVKDKNISAKQKLRLIKQFDQVLGLDLLKKKTEKIPLEIINLAQQREKQRKNKQWQKADQLRKTIEKKGYLIEDTKQGSKIKRNMLS
jgi:cysteinyl-tRNA synthetase